MNGGGVGGSNGKQTSKQAIMVLRKKNLSLKVKKKPKKQNK